MGIREDGRQSDDRTADEDDKCGPPTASGRFGFTLLHSLDFSQQTDYFFVLIHLMIPRRHSLQHTGGYLSELQVRNEASYWLTRMVQWPFLTANDRIQSVPAAAAKCARSRQCIECVTSWQNVKVTTNKTPSTAITRTATDLRSRMTVAPIEPEPSETQDAAVRIV
jgi:hypothetical protein